MAVKVSKTVKAARALEATIAKSNMKNAAAVGRGARIHKIAKDLTRPLERFGVRVDRTIPGSKLRPDWRVGRLAIELKPGSLSGVAGGKKAVAAYGRAMMNSGIRNPIGILVTYPTKPGNILGWRISRLM
jgi:hypothetical protein